MNRERLLYFIAAALFAAAAAINIAKNGRIDLVAGLMVVTAAALAWLGLRKRPESQ